MATNFPTSLDTLVNPLPGDNVNAPSHAAQHTNANDAIEALEQKVGITNSAVTTTHDYRISQVEALVGSAVSGSKSIIQDVRNQSGVSLTKATPVYVSGSTGASGQLLVSRASNSSESTSSKTMGLTSSTISNNSNGQVISDGILEGIDTTGAVDGDPVWLGTSGQKIYGIANKPYGSAHLVFLGIVIRGGQQNTGSMYVKIQNGFEIEELHNVSAQNPATGDILVYNATTGLWELETSTTFVTTTDLGNSLGSYVLSSEVSNPDGVASLDSSGTVPDAQLAANVTRDSNTQTLTNKSISISSGLTSVSGYDNITAFFGQSNIIVFQDGIDKGGRINISSVGVITQSVPGAGYTPGLGVIGGGTRVVIGASGNIFTGRLVDFNAALIDGDFATASDISTAISNLVDSSPAALNTLNELAAALNDDENYATTVTTALSGKAPIASPALTGTPTAPTPAAGDSTTKIATTAYVQDSLGMVMALAL